MRVPQTSTNRCKDIFLYEAKDERNGGYLIFLSFTHYADVLVYYAC